MKKSIKVLIMTSIVGYVGIYIGAFMNLEGYLGVILAISTMGYFIVSSIEDISQSN